MTSLLARIKIVPQKLVNVGSLVRMKERAWGLWPTYHACTCSLESLEKDEKGYHLRDWKKVPRWCGPQERPGIGIDDPTKRVNISDKSIGLVVDCAYWEERPLWIVLVDETYVAVNDDFLLVL